MQHAGQGDVAHVAPAPGEQPRVFLAEMPVPDELHAGSPAPRRTRRGIERGEHDVLVARAAAEVPRQRLADVRLGRLGVLAQIRVERHEDAGRAESALQRVAGPEGLLQRVQARAIARQSLDGVHPGAVGLHGEDQAGARGLAVDEHRAGPAGAVLAAQVRAREAEVLAQQIREEHARDHARPPLGAVHEDGDVMPRVPRGRSCAGEGGRFAGRRGLDGPRRRAPFACRRRRLGPPSRRLRPRGRAAEGLRREPRGHPAPVRGGRVQIAARVDLVGGRPTQLGQPRRRRPLADQRGVARASRGASPAPKITSRAWRQHTRRVERDDGACADQREVAVPPRHLGEAVTGAGLGRPGTSISASNSSGSSAVASRPRKKSSARHARAPARAPQMQDRAERDHAGGKLGRRIRMDDAAPDRPARPRLHMPDDRRRLGEQGRGSRRCAHRARARAVARARPAEDALRPPSHPRDPQRGSDPRRQPAARGACSSSAPSSAHQQAPWRHPHTAPGDPAPPRQSAARSTRRQPAARELYRVRAPSAARLSCQEQEAGRCVRLLLLNRP